MNLKQRLVSIILQSCNHSPPLTFQEKLLGLRPTQRTVMLHLFSGELVLGFWLYFQDPDPGHYSIIKDGIQKWKKKSKNTIKIKFSKCLSRSIFVRLIKVFLPCCIKLDKWAEFLLQMLRLLFESK